MAKWHNRAAILAEFTDALSKQSAGEDFSIDCSSSDEEVSLTPKIAVMQPLLSSTSIKLPEIGKCEINKTESWSPLKSQHKKTSSPSVPSVTGQNSPLAKKNREIKHQEVIGKRIPIMKVCSLEKLNLSNEEGFLPVSTPHDTSKPKNKIDNNESVIFPSSKARFCDEPSSDSTEVYNNVNEPQSPVLGWRRTVPWSCSPLIKKKKAKIKTSFSASVTHKLPKRKLADSNIASVKRQIICEDERVQINFGCSAGTEMNKEEHCSLNSDSNQFINSNVHCNINLGKLNYIHVSEPDKYKRKSRVGQDGSQSQHTKCYSPPQSEAFRREQSLPCQSNNICTEENVQSKNEGQSNSTISCSDLKYLALPDQNPLQGEPELCADNQVSQNIDVTSEGTENQVVVTSEGTDSQVVVKSEGTDSQVVVTSEGTDSQVVVTSEGTDSQVVVKSEVTDSQVDYNIEMPQTPTKSSFESTNVSEDADFSGTQISQDLNLLEPEHSTRSGFDWVKHLQTPEKYSSNENVVDGIESCKKNFIKDGHAERLKRLLTSWRSDISLWNHEFSLRVLHKASPRQSSPLPFGVLQSADNKNSVVKLQSLEQTSEAKPLHSPAVRRNLQDLLIENSSSTPGTPSPCRVSSKYLELKLVDMGGLLPNNAAVCEIMDSSVEGFQITETIKMESTDKTEADNTKKKFLVFFAVNEHNISSLCKFDTVKIYAPWQNLSVAGHEIPALFTSFYSLSMREKGPLPLVHGQRKTVFTWTCSCSDGTAPESLCKVQSCSFPWVSCTQPHHIQLLGLNSGFTTIKDTPETPPQNDKLRAGTILEALEKCGGASAVPVNITVRVHRTITQRKSSSTVDAWELLGQDAAGQFCLVKIPNRPLAQDLKEVFSDPSNNNCTHTFTHLTLCHRLTNTQDPGLFSLITSLHKSYQNTVLGDPHLQPLFKKLVSHSPQTSCYVLIASLGVTRVLHNEEQVMLPINLPHWSLQEARAVSCDGHRGSITVYALYKSDSSLYVMCLTSYKKMNPAALFSKEKKTETSLREDSESQRNILAWRVQLMGAVMPPWIPESGAVMMPVILRDVVMWHGTVVLDEYSSIELQKEASTKIDVVSLNEVLSPMPRLIHQECLTLVSGTIVNVDEENAFIYLTCGNCNSDKVQEIEGGLVDCSHCGQKLTAPGKAYSLEVWVDCGPDLQCAAVKVKLCQKTIENLLLLSCEPQEEAICASTLLGRQIGPMPCVLLQEENHSRHSNRTFSLAELPL